LNTSIHTLIQNDPGNTVYFSDFNSSDGTFPLINNVNPLEILKDFKFLKFGKKYQRPYFNPCHNSWEMDYVNVSYPNKQICTDRKK
jgi:hypothetical protein